MPYHISARARSLLYRVGLPDSRIKNRSLESISNGFKRYKMNPQQMNLHNESLSFQLIQRDPDLRIGGGGDASNMQSAIAIREHPFFSQMPMDSDEAAQHAAEHAERVRHQHAIERDRMRRSRTAGESISAGAGDLLRSLSNTTGRSTICCCVCPQEPLSSSLPS